MATLKLKQTEISECPFLESCALRRAAREFNRPITSIQNQAALSSLYAPLPLFPFSTSDIDTFACRDYGEQDLLPVVEIDSLEFSTFHRSNPPSINLHLG